MKRWKACSKSLKFMVIKKDNLVSAHGGHSGEFCLHAKDTLEDIIKEYIKKGFYAVGITEHTPPLSSKFMYDEERDAGFSVEDLNVRFEKYFEKLIFLKEKYKDKIKIYAGFETETHTGFENHIKGLVKKFKPDYFVGSLHHTNDVEIDHTKEKYDIALKLSGSKLKLYEDYFDLQNRMILALKPRVIGHLDIIRIFDEDYEENLKKVKHKILRNLETIKKTNSLVELNMRPVFKGGSEPFPCRFIRTLIYEKKIPFIMSDDSHSVDSVGAKIKEGIELIEKEKGIITYAL